MEEEMEGYEDVQMYDGNYTYEYVINETFFRLKQAQYLAYDNFIRRRSMFRHFYHAFSALIFLSNLLLIIAILVSKKQRRHFRNWLILNLALVNILVGGISCPYVGHKLSGDTAGLGTVVCKLFEFVSETLTYMTNVSAAVLGMYHLLSLCSSRLLNGVSNALMTAIMIATPWVVSLMMTVVLRLAMSDETRGQCYLITDSTTQNLWLSLGIIVPLLLTLVTLIGILIIVCASVAITTDDAHSSRGRRNTTVFVVVCLVANLLFQAPYSILHSDAIAPKCSKQYHYYTCAIVIYSLDQVRLFSMVVIPLVYLIPKEVRRFVNKMKRIVPKSVAAKSSAKTKQQQQQQTRIELHTVKTGDKPLVGTT